MLDRGLHGCVVCSKLCRAEERNFESEAPSDLCDLFRVGAEHTTIDAARFACGVHCVGQKRATREFAEILAGYAL
jgi:hypothetical protein